MNSTAPDTSAVPGTETLPGSQLSTLSPQLATLPRRADGSVDWRATVQPEHLYVKGEHKETVAKLLNKPVAEIYNLSAEDTKKVPDRYLVIRKAGILALARLRGFVSETPDVQHATRDYVIVRSLISWTPFENMPLISGGVGEACPENTSELGSRYLASNAENRAFAKNVRDYLEIDIVCSDELGKDGQEPEQNANRVASAATSAPASGGSVGFDLTPQGRLTHHATEAGYTFDQVKQAAAARWKEDSDTLAANPALADDPNWKRRIENDPEVWANWQEIPPRDCSTLISLIKTAKAAREQAAKAKAAAASTANAPTPSTPTPSATTPATVKAKRTVARKPGAPVIPISEGATGQQPAAA